MKESSENNLFLLDNRPVLELQNFVLQFAALLKIADGKKVKNWQEYLLQNIGFRLAYLLTIDTNNIRENIIYTSDKLKKYYQYQNIPFAILDLSDNDISKEQISNIWLYIDDFQLETSSINGEKNF